MMAEHFNTKDRFILGKKKGFILERRKLKITLSIRGKFGLLKQNLHQVEEKLPKVCVVSEYRLKDHEFNFTAGISVYIWTHFCISQTTQIPDVGTNSRDSRNID